ncbi:hypothetical protein LOD99_932 [Oopsacas minuta]|uniref:ATP-dependent RNA helicase n=1 Tax=Oopsacas minuta TaxID=111878 RepID=A0AAV7K2P7_9METZ|nr:hypothetical protein LOD99_932 [Oopsacas minuta]
MYKKKYIRGQTKPKRSFQKASHLRKSRWAKERAAIDKVQQSIQELKPQSITSFRQIPLSSLTQEGLTSSGFSAPTDIQRETLPIALRSGDILGTAKTGSGKTLAFVIPVLECLWREQWGAVDGVGGIVISPTRELAFQTFEVLRKVGVKHELSAGLIIGGKNISEEQDRICATNILICTPGRLLQHMDETPAFDCSNLKILVLDEADRILDLGFKDTLDSILENLPASRQTLLFSATFNKSVHNLARLSLNNPDYVSVHAADLQATPSNLTQSYVICSLEHKLDLLFSFIKAHLKSKVLVFISTCKQVRFVYETFRRMRPGIPLLALFGRMNQTRRMCVYQSFFQRDSAILFATDIAARGLDFPKVNWVFQLDCPPNTDEYIHRVGRTARYHSGGQALLVLLPSENKFIELLENNRLSLTQIKPNRAHLFSISERLSYFCAEDSSIKYWAQRAYVNYIKSVAKESNKQVFDITQIPLEKFSHAIGLPITPRVRYLNKVISTKQESNIQVNEDREESVSDETAVPQVLLHIKRKLSEVFDDSEELDLALVPKKRKVTSQIAISKKLLKKNIRLNSKLVFDEEGNVLEAIKYGKKIDASELIGSKDKKKKFKPGLDLSEARQSLDDQLEGDKERDHERVTAKHRMIKQKLKKSKVRKLSPGIEARLRDSDYSQSDTESTPARDESNEVTVDLTDIEDTILATIGHTP